MTEPQSLPSGKSMGFQLPMTPRGGGKGAKPASPEPPVATVLELVRSEVELRAGNIPTIAGVDDRVLLAEMGYALHPDAHEGRIAPYGALLAPDRVRGNVGRRVGTGLPIDQLRAFADGRQRVVAHQAGMPVTVLRLSKELNDELDVLRLVSSTAGVVIKRRETGIVTLASEGRVYTIRQREWLTRPSLDDHVGAVWQTIGPCWPRRSSVTT